MRMAHAEEATTMGEGSTGEKSRADWPKPLSPDEVRRQTKAALERSKNGAGSGDDDNDSTHRPLLTLGHEGQRKQKGR